MNDTAVEYLAAAIIEQAIKDHRAAKKDLNADDEETRRRAELMLEDIHAFFTGEWFAALSSADGEKILKKLHEVA